MRPEAADKAEKTAPLFRAQKSSETAYKFLVRQELVLRSR
jgi:hypothetical protein